MGRLSPRAPVRRAISLLARLLGSHPRLVVLPKGAMDLSNSTAVRVGDSIFLIEWVRTFSMIPASVALLRQLAPRIGGRQIIPLLVVPNMGPRGQELCERTGIGWMDLSGNARITAPGIHIRVEGQPNLLKKKGRPSNVFAPKSARIARWILMHSPRAFSLRELAAETEMDPGFTSRIVTRLVHDHLLIRDNMGKIRVRDPELLLDTWHDTYDFSQHSIQKGRVPTRSSEALQADVAAKLANHNVEYAATGLGAAWLLTHFAGFRIVTFYVKTTLDPLFLKNIGFGEEPRGANMWFVVPRDSGIFHGASTRQNICHVHPVQIYLDLKAHPERAKEAAQELRNRLLKWR